MSLRSKLGRENIGMVASFAFYAAAGIICFVLFLLADFPPHIGIISILSLIAAYGIFRKRVWTIWLVVMLFFIVTTFSAYTLYYFVDKDLLLAISMTAYLISTWVFTAYTALKRKILEN